jgi:hypothetical protein
VILIFSEKNLLYLAVFSNLQVSSFLSKGLGRFS